MTQTLAQWTPMREIEEFFGRALRPFRATPGAQEAMTQADWIPAVDIRETDDEYVIEMDLPQVKKDDVHISLDENVLTIRGERRREHEENQGRWHRVERFYGTFARSFVLPETVEEDGIRAVFEDGVLTVHLPKTAEARPRSREIEITTA